MTHPTAPHSVKDAHASAYHRVRIALGLLGFALPLLLALTGLMVDGRVQPSISDFFHTSARDLFVGGLTAIAVFLVTHQGLGCADGDKKCRSRLGAVFAMLAGISALGVALVPNEAEAVTTLSQELLGLQRAPALHYGSATLFYLMMSLTCLMIYARQTTGWEKRFHRAMGWTVWSAGWAVMLLTYWKRGGAGPELQAFTEANNLIFWDESLGVWAFCLSWLVQAHMEYRRAVAKAAVDGRAHDRADMPMPVWTTPAAPTPGPGSRQLAGFVLTVTAPLSALLSGAAPVSTPLPQAIQEDETPIQPVMMRRHHRSSTHARADFSRRAPAQTGLQRRG